MATLLAQASGERLDIFLTKNLQDSPLAPSRSKVQQWLQAGKVKVNGQLAKANYVVQAGDEIEYEASIRPPSHLSAEALPLSIIYEDEEVVVVDKAAGVVVHPGAGNPSGTLVNALLHHTNAKLAPSANQERPGIVHRIDKNTSGLLVVAKTELAHRLLTAQFQARTIERSYLALAWGELPGAGDWHGNIGRDPRHRQRMAVVDEGGKVAHTQFALLEKFGLIASYLRAKLFTGRTHQIRVHAAHFGFPLVGDALYAKFSRSGQQRFLAGMQNLRRHHEDIFTAVTDLQTQGRQFLHAETLGFIHPLSAKPLHFQSPLPANLANLLTQFRNIR